jgi:hypothetical protein
MLDSLRDTDLAPRPDSHQTNNLQQRREMDVETVDQNDIHQALAVIAPAPECSHEPHPNGLQQNCLISRLITFRTDLRSSYTMYVNRSKMAFLSSFFSDNVVRLVTSVLYEGTNPCASNTSILFSLHIDRKNCQHERLYTGKASLGHTTVHWP